MQQSFDAMTTALRVLKAVTEKQLHDPADIAALRDLAGAQPQDIDADELACEVIQKALKRRVAAREARRRLEYTGID
jgi:hypothetical protein